MSGARRQPSEAGFTLIETLVALAILGIVMSAVYAVIGSGLRTAHRDEDRLLLALVAQNLLARSGYDLDARRGDLSGDIGGGLRWRIESTPYELPEGILPEPEPEFDAPALPPAGGAGGGSTAETGFGRGQSDSGRGAGSEEGLPGSGATAGSDSPGEANSLSDRQRDAEARRPRVQLRLVRVTVEKGGQTFQLSSLALDPAPENERAR